MRTVETYKFEANGRPYTYIAREEREDFDGEGAHNVKIYHEVYDGQKRIPMDWTSYSIPTKEEVRTWVELGMPDRRQAGINGPLNSEILQRLKARATKSGNLEEGEIDWLKKWAGIV